MRKLKIIGVLLFVILFTACGSDGITIEGKFYKTATFSDASDTMSDVVISGTCVDGFLDESGYIHFIVETGDGNTIDVRPNSHSFYSGEIDTAVFGKTIRLFGRFSNAESLFSENQGFCADYLDIDGVRYSGLVNFENLDFLLAPQEEPTAKPTPSASPEPTASPYPHVFSPYFQQILEGRSEIPDYSIYNDYAKNNGKEYTYIVMYGTFDNVYDLNGYLHIEFLENGENRYALCAGFSDEETKERLEELSGKEAEVLACYTGFSDISKTPCAILYEYYCDGEVHAEIWNKVVSDGFSDFGKPSGGKELEDFFPEAEDSSAIESSSAENFASTSTSDLDDSESSVIETSPHSGSVWIPTNGGTKYHTNSSCSNMENPQKVSEDEAIAMGFEPCKRCH